MRLNWGIQLREAFSIGDILLLTKLKNYGKDESRCFDLKDVKT